jgi:uncharacterized protein YaiI (UPF0178 family)
MKFESKCGAIILGDLAVTADIPLPADVVAKGGHALESIGVLHTDANVGERAAFRDLIDGRGDEGPVGRPPNFRPNDKETFAKQLSRCVTKVRFFIRRLVALGRLGIFDWRRC